MPNAIPAVAINNVYVIIPIQKIKGLPKIKNCDIDSKTINISENI